MVAFDLVTIDEVLALGCYRRRHVTIDHVAIRLLRGAREHIGSGLHLPTRDSVVWRGRRDGTTASSLLLLQEVLEGDGDSRHVGRGVLAL